jgi:hypothetical protein
MEVVQGNSLLLAPARWLEAADSGAIAALVTDFLLGRLPPSVIRFYAMAFFHSRSLIVRHYACRPNLLGASICGEFNHLMGNVILPIPPSSLYSNMYSFGRSFSFQAHVLSFKNP